MIFSIMIHLNQEILSYILVDALQVEKDLLGYAKNQYYQMAFRIQHSNQGAIIYHFVIWKNQEKILRILKIL
ncbi:hypothetical protein TTHERM_002653341 (macronuclear) [Tetrahymena thermophila SB210]|uniref:Uncharacterized protein n=1 Tax=Tetrahymena thermophila (strain SB210) TaxID=312017 RepID=W7X3T2_TETTS|nr:hypothetical protein TTHERM_002653341 [Tetrahymena thermophila SB210]EWS72102.1 hypothetical protein TTHERM_002653341 [Tetrahymena thermophila SB210]|eukprot:XP_012655363.1 hypothetical protein TTHERM_002653341 [Tetrahymena thermophila SB210]